ncbi:amidase [Pseudooctadecabacter jejudonensis]|uniref:Glutamyl-tRNA(Gln) amidotransferase subunit A n=1 Tax=Pseudooctadecabacter jejudonensis TaxID=1391910 RepID=A0A1Y5SE49_9RHOB|nr:amidase family protein [Pseudooctadecabacter jejudonensis]SLN35596.1 Glutamyl-tRNA(Gln) amidotransferase subunit A [Pseudooctadecabacter jejudonensis]
MQDWLWATAADLGRGIGAGDIDPVDLCEVYLAAIEAHPHRDRIYARVTADRARVEAAAASDRARAGRRVSPLDGVPVSWKDLFDTAGVATEAGTALMAGRVPQNDAEVLRAATAAGLVCLGKTHMSEIAFSGLGLNPITATPPCVNDDAAVPGGSSSGAAASVAFGLAAAAIGSDTGGSVRIPSIWNDLVGFKTTHGRLSLTGVVPLCSEFDTVGPLCRSVEDAALVTAALEGSRAPDLAGASLTGLRFAALQSVVLDDVAEASMAGYHAALKRLADAGAVIEEVAAPELERAFAMSLPLYTADAYANWRDLVEAAPDKMFPQILERVSAGRDVPAHDYLALWAELRDLRRSYDARMAGFDAVLCPGAANMPPDADRLMTDDAYYKTQNLLTLRNTRVANLMGGASVALPVGVPSVGLLINVAGGQDDRLLRIAAAAEAALR